MNSKGRVRGEWEREVRGGARGEWEGGRRYRGDWEGGIRMRGRRGDDVTKGKGARG